MAVAIEAATERQQQGSDILRLVRIFLRFEKLLIPHWHYLLLIMLLGQARAFCIVFTASCGGQVLDTLIQHDWRWFNLWMLGNVSGQIGMSVTGLLNAIVQAYLVQRVLLTMQLNLFRHVNRQSVRFHSSRPIGEHMYRVTQDPFSGAAIICVAVPTILNFFQTLITALVAARALDRRVMWTLLAYFVTYLVYAHWLAGIVREFLHRQRRGAQRNTAVLQESLAGFRAVLAFGRERFERLKFFRSLTELYRRNIKYLIIGGFLGSSSRLIERVFHGIAVWLVAGGLVLQGTITIGQWFALALLMGQISISLEVVILFLQSIRIQLVFAERMLETLDVEPEIQDAPNAVKLPPVQGRVEFRNVRFSYVPGEEVLKNVSFTIEPGTCVSLVGPSGSGKSTTIGLIERFYDPDEGHVLIDGHDVRTVTQRSLRKRMSLAFQEPLLCSGTILENFRYGAPHASLAEIRDVAHVVDMDSYIEGLERGYDTLLSEAGNLSGGQQQRLALGRALLTDAEILLLDEPTSALDPKTEEAVVRRLRDYARGKTIVLVTHSLRNVRDADKILLLDQGKIVAEGTHEQLLESSPLYADLWAEDEEKRERSD